MFWLCLSFQSILKAHLENILFQNCSEDIFLKCLKSKLPPKDVTSTTITSEQLYNGDFLRNE